MLCLEQFSGSYEQKVIQLYQMLKQYNLKSDEDKRTSREVDVYYDFTPSLVKKRISSTVAYQMSLQKELGTIASLERLSDMFAFSNGMILRGGYTNFDISFAVVVASAIWILDQLKIQGDLEKIYPYLLISDGKDVNFFIHHPQYSDELIAALIVLIYSRNEDEISLTLLPKTRSTSEIRKAYDSVIALINQDAINEVKEKYERKIWEFYRLTFESYIKIQDEEERIIKEIEKLQKSVMRNSSALMQNRLFGSNDVTTEKIQRLKYKLERLQNTAWYTEIGLPDSREKAARRFRDIIGEDMVSKLTTFSVDDPFEYAFALHILLDEDSLIPWLYYGSICLTYTFVDQLPFNIPFAKKEAPQLIKNIGNTLYSLFFFCLSARLRTISR